MSEEIKFEDLTLEEQKRLKHLVAVKKWNSKNRDKRKGYKKKYYDNNKEYVKEYNHNYYERKKQERLLQSQVQEVN